MFGLHQARKHLEDLDELGIRVHTAAKVRLATQYDDISAICICACAGSMSS